MKILLSPPITMILSVVLLTAGIASQFAHAEGSHRHVTPGSHKHSEYDPEKSEQIYKKEIDHLSKVDEQMNLMQEQMNAIHAEKDPKKQRALMKEHKKTMHEAMSMMHGPGASMMSMGANSDDETREIQLGRHTHITKQMSPEQRADVMEQHMVLMQKMMNQMMQHQSAGHDMQSK